MKQRLNYTGRKRITQDRLEFHISENSEGVPLLFTRRFELEDMSLSPSGRIFITVDRGLSLEVERIDAGTIGAPKLPDAYPLTRFNAPDGLRVDVDVVEELGEQAGKKLAVAKSIKPKLAIDEESPSSRISLLPFVPSEDLGQQLWRLEISDSDPPVVAVNAKLPNWRSLGRSEAFQVMVLPEVARQIANWLLMNAEGDEAEGEPLHHWRLFFESLDPLTLEGRPDGDDREAWATDRAAQLAETVARRIDTLERANPLFAGEED